MNTNLNEMPTGIDVQLMVLGLKYDNEVWTLGKKDQNGKIAVAGFATEECKILGWKHIEE